MSILDVFIILLLISWIGGFSLSIGGAFIHLLLIAALVVLILRLLGNGRSVSH